MTPQRHFIAARSYFFREQCARRDHILHKLTLADFRAFFAVATRRAAEWDRQRNNRFNHATRQWVQS